MRMMILNMRNGMTTHTLLKNSSKHRKSIYLIQDNEKWKRRLDIRLEQGAELQSLLIGMI